MCQAFRNASICKIRARAAQDYFAALVEDAFNKLGRWVRCGGVQFIKVENRRQFRRLDLKKLDLRDSSTKNYLRRLRKHGIINSANWLKEDSEASNVMPVNF